MENETENQVKNENIEIIEKKKVKSSERAYFTNYYKEKLKGVKLKCVNCGCEASKANMNQHMKSRKCFLVSEMKKNTKSICDGIFIILLICNY